MIVRALERRKVPTDFAWRRILGSYGGLSTDAGMQVNEASALSLPTVFAAVRLMSNLVASLPLILYRRDASDPRKIAPQREHPLFPVLHSLANPRATAFEARSFTVAQVFLRGNSAAFVERDSLGRTIALWPLRWDLIEVHRAADRRLKYRWSPSHAPGETFDEREVWHPKGLSMDGVLGLSPVAATKEAFGAALAMQRYASVFFANGASPSGVLTHPGTLGTRPEDRDGAVARIRTQWDELHTGAERAHRVVVLEEGMKFEATSLNAQETQILEARKFSRQELAAVFGIPLHLVGDLERATFSNIEQQSLELLIYHLTPFLVALEQTMERDLLSATERAAGYFLRHKVDGLLRGDSATRWNNYRTAVTTGILSRNEVRLLEELEPKDGLDDYLTPLNMAQGPGDGVTPSLPIRPEVSPRALPAPVVPSALALAAHAGETRAAISRPALARAFRPVLEDALGRLVRREARDLRKRLEIHLGANGTRDEASLDLELEEWYAEGSEFSSAISQTLSPAIRALAEQAFEAAATETEQAPDRRELELFFAALLGATTARYAIASRKALHGALHPESLEGLDPSPRARVEALLAKWIDERPGRAAARESVQVSRASALEAFRRGGATMKRWVGRGDDCAFCQMLDGQVVPMAGAFLESGQTIASGDRTFTAGTRIGHAPLHRGCDCDVAPA